jgi:acetyl esterase/lipase
MTHASQDQALAALCVSWSTQRWQRLTAIEAAATSPRPGRVHNPDASHSPDASFARDVYRLAGKHPRGGVGLLSARVSWPTPATPAATGPALLVFLHASRFVRGSIRSGDTPCRGPWARAGVAMLSMPYRPIPGNPDPAAFHDAATVMEWAADHYLNLDGRQESPSCTEHAAATTNSAASMRWHRQHHLPVAPQPRLAKRCRCAPSLAWGGQGDGGHGRGRRLRDGGRRSTARLRQAGVAELRYHDLVNAPSPCSAPGAVERMPTDLKHVLHRFVAVRSPPARGGFEL